MNGVSVNPNSVTNNFYGNPGTINSAVLEPDGSIVLAGGGYTTSGQPSDFVSKLEPDGQLDPTFGTDGTAVIPIMVNPGLQDSASVGGLALQPDGKLVVAGEAVSNTERINQLSGDLIRLNTDGTQDLTFGGAAGGQVDFANASFGGLIEQPDGKLLLQDGFSGLLRLNADASVDPTFGQGGMVILPYEPDVTDPIALQPNGQIVVAGNFPVLGTLGPTLASLPQEFGSLRINADGTLDTSYGNSSVLGLAQYHFGSPYLDANAAVIAIQPTDGNIVVAGTAATFLVQDGTLPAVAVARALAAPSTGVGVIPPPPTAPASFDGTDQTDLAVYEPISGEFAFRTMAVIGQPDQFIPFGTPGAGQTIPAPADYQGDGQDQIAAYLPASGIYAVRPGDGPDQYYSIGLKGAGQTIPTPADYFRTGQADVAVYNALERHLHHRGPLEQVLRRDHRLRRPGSWPVDPGAGRLLRHRPGRHRRLSDPDRRLCHPQPDHRPGLHHPLWQAGDGPVGPRAGRLRRLGPRRAGGVHPQLRCGHLPLGDHRQGRDRPGRRGELGGDRGAGRLRRIGADRGGDLRPEGRVLRVPARKRRPGGDRALRRGRQRRDPAGGVAGHGGGLFGIGLGRSRPIGGRHPGLDGTSPRLGLERRHQGGGPGRTDGDLAEGGADARKPGDRGPLAVRDLTVLQDSTSPGTARLSEGIGPTSLR